MTPARRRRNRRLSSRRSSRTTQPRRCWPARSRRRAGPPSRRSSRTAQPRRCLPLRVSVSSIYWHRPFERKWNACTCVINSSIFSNRNGTKKERRGGNLDMLLTGVIVCLWIFRVRVSCLVFLRVSRFIFAFRVSSASACAALYAVRSGSQGFSWCFSCSCFDNSDFLKNIRHRLKIGEVRCNSAFFQHICENPKKCSSEKFAMNIIFRNAPFAMVFGNFCTMPFCHFWRKMA